MAEESLIINIEKDKWTNFKIDCDNNKPITRYLYVDGKNQAQMIVVQMDTRHLNFGDKEVKNAADIRSFVLFKVYQMRSLEFEALVSHNDGRAKRYSSTCLTRNTYFKEGHLKVLIRFSDKMIVPKNKNSILADIRKQFIENSPDVTLVGHDGEVVVKLGILVARSKVFKAMFDPEKKSQELQNLRVEIPDSSKAALSEFSAFLVTDTLSLSSKNHLELLILADKYDVPFLRYMTRLAAVENLDDTNARETFEVFSKVCPEALANIFVSNCKKIKASPFLDAEMDDPSVTKEMK